MYTFLQFVLLVVGFVLLVKGADFFVDGASGIAKKLKVSSFLIGVTVVAFGTSAPELAVTITDALGGNGELIVGNILGSNIINIFLILGISAIVNKLPVEKSTRNIDITFLIAVSLLFLVFGITASAFVWWEGLILVALYALYMGYNVFVAKRQAKVQLEEATAATATFESENAIAEVPANWYKKMQAGYENLLEKVWFLIVITLAGLGMVVGGAQLVVNSASYIAKEVFHIPAGIVALTVVALGTSLPELVTSVAAAKKGDVGIAIGNIIGSNIANILLIGGVGALCSGTTGILFSTEGIISSFVALFAAILVFVLSLNKTSTLGKVGGIIMLCCLVAYYVFIFLNYFVLNIYPSGV